MELIVQAGPCYPRDKMKEIVDLIHALPPDEHLRFLEIAYGNLRVVTFEDILKSPEEIEVEDIAKAKISAIGRGIAESHGLRTWEARLIGKRYEERKNYYAHLHTPNLPAVPGCLCEECDIKRHIQEIEFRKLMYAPPPPIIVSKEQAVRLIKRNKPSWWERVKLFIFRTKPTC